MQSYARVEPKDTYPSDPPAFSFGQSCIVFLKNWKGFEIGDEVFMQNTSRYQLLVKYMVDDYEIKDVSKFQAGVHFNFL